MSQNDDTQDEELIARYRRASGDATGPSDAVRAAILAESRRTAEDLAQAPQHPFDASRPAANDSRWKIPAYATVGVALLAALLFAPRYWENVSPTSVGTPQANTSQTSTAPQASMAQQSSAAPQVNTEPAASPAAGESSSLQEVVVTKANRQSAKTAGKLSLEPPAPAPNAPPNAAQNYAPATNSVSPLAVAPAAQAARARPSDLLSAHAIESAALPVIGGVAADAAATPATLESAVAQGDVAQTASLLDRGAIIDARDAAGRTPLMLAVTEDRAEIVRLLLARGANPNAVDNAGNTPLQQATKRNLQDVAALLQQAGAR
jgi:hypothetical protein